MRLNDNTILITGGSSGIGLALAKSFYHLGNKVIIVARNLEKLTAVKLELPEVVIFPCDLTKQAEIDHLILFVKQHYPKLNMIFNNAGIQYNYDFLQEQNLVTKIDAEISANLTATIKLCGLLLPTLLKNTNSAILNVSSGLAISPKKSAPVYCCTKAAVHHFTKAFRYQMENTHLKVFEILPPLVHTPMTEGRGKNKISAEQVVIEFLQDFQNNREEIYIGKSKLLKLISRISPGLADRILKNS